MPRHGIDVPLAIVIRIRGSITIKVVNKARSHVMCDVAPESTSQILGFIVELGAFPTVQAPSGGPVAILDLERCFIGFLAAHLVPSSVPSHSGQAVRMWF